jgi:hypothetical protein
MVEQIVELRDFYERRVAHLQNVFETEIAGL